MFSDTIAANAVVFFFFGRLEWLAPVHEDVLEEGVAAAAAEGSQHASAVAEGGSAAAPAALATKAAEALLPSLSIWPLSQTLI